MDNEDEKNYAIEEDEIIERKSKITNHLGEMLRFNLSGYRSFLIALTSISLAIMGATISSLDKFHTQAMLIGIICLFFSVIISVIYLLRIFKSENSDLSEYLNFQKEASKKLHNKLIEYFNAKKPFALYVEEKLKLFAENREEEQSLTNKYYSVAQKIDKWPKRIVFLFVAGLGFLAIALIPTLLS